ncbi:hypothetical protein [Cohnella sp.]|uniref:hypothetical protein n=1 Tax=Cohnella sp. TaxID=1883426 RepID=UPI003566C5CB
MSDTRAEWMGRYEGEVARIFAEASGGLPALPASLTGLAAALLEKFNPVSSNGRGADGGTNYICFLLPLWLKEQTGCGDELCRDLAIGNVYAMLHFFLLDDAMDAAAAAGVGETRRSLALGQMFYEGFRRRYERHFPTGSSLWQRYGAYLTDWAAAVSEEGERLAEPGDPAALARKSAPVKLCAAGLLLLSGQTDRLRQTEEAVDLVLATLQLSDDWADWREDLAEDGEKRNAFLTLVRRTLPPAAEQPLDERAVNQAVYRNGCLRDLARIARDHHAALTKLPNVPRALLSFHEEIVIGLERDARGAAELEEKLALEGGLSVLLSNLAKK